MTTLDLARGDVIETFSVPPGLKASGPAEARGLARDGVRLMIADGAGIRHSRFVDLAAVLLPGDLLVVNNSATTPAGVVVDDHRVVHFSTRQPGGFVVVELRRPVGHSSSPDPDASAGMIEMPGGRSLEVLAPFPAHSGVERLWLARLDSPEQLGDYLDRWGRPIRYEYAASPWPISVYQTVFSTVPGSAEMPSAGRPFSPGLVCALVSRGVGLAPLTLHTGVSSLESGEEPYPEWVDLPPHTANRINETRNSGGRVVAVGTTVVRAIATATDHTGLVHPIEGWTDRVVEASDDLDGIDGLITGWHEPNSSHLALLEAVAGRNLLSDAYRGALDQGYLWHEFGDSLLLLPGRR